jgi:hypothetical protein
LVDHFTGHGRDPTRKEKHPPPRIYHRSCHRRHTVFTGHGCLCMSTPLLPRSDRKSPS